MTSYGTLTGAVAADDLPEPSRPDLPQAILSGRRPEVFFLRVKDGCIPRVPFAYKPADLLQLHAIEGLRVTNFASLESQINRLQLEKLAPATDPCLSMQK